MPCKYSYAFKIFFLTCWYSSTSALFFFFWQLFWRFLKKGTHNLIFRSHIWLANVPNPFNGMCISAQQLVWNHVLSRLGHSHILHLFALTTSTSGIQSWPSFLRWDIFSVSTRHKILALQKYFGCKKENVVCLQVCSAVCVLLLCVAIWVHLTPSSQSERQNEATDVTGPRTHKWSEMEMLSGIVQSNIRLRK